MTREQFMAEEIEDPDEMCLHCGSLIDSNYRICPVCGQVWYVREDLEKTCDMDCHTKAVKTK